jgi:amino acid transporter
MRLSHDVELANIRPKEASFAQGSVLSMRGTNSSRNNRSSNGGDDGPQAHPLRRWLDSFRRDPNRHVTPASAVYAAGANRASTIRGSTDLPLPPERSRAHYFDMHAATAGTANTLLSRELKGRHLQMIAIGGSIGTGLFVASGKALNTGGPASLLIAYLFVGVMLYCTIQALGELAVTFPVAGSFSAYSTRFLDPAWGFAMGWK